jgi:hypothetical protein
VKCLPQYRVLELLSAGEPRPAVGIDIGDGVVLRYDEDTQEVLGLTVIGLRAKLAQVA